MKRLMLACGLLAYAILLPAQSPATADALTGTWKGDMAPKGETSRRAITMELKFDGKSAVSGTVSVMFPMITTLNELRDVKAILAEEAAGLGVPSVPAGIMVEVPAAAVMAAQFAREAEFFSIGTNDLTQYTLAMDRGHPKLAPQVDGLSPAVLKLIAHTVNGARSEGRRVGVCGGIGSDPDYDFMPAGRIDDLRIWSVARTQEQIRQAMYASYFPEETALFQGLEAWYRFEGDGMDSRHTHHGTVNLTGTGFGTGLVFVLPKHRGASH